MVYLPGEEVVLAADEGQLQLNYRAEITGIEQIPTVQLVVNGAYLPVCVTETGINRYEASISMAIPKEEWIWTRLDVRTKEGAFLGYINPIYYGRKTPAYATFGEIVTAIGEV